MSRALIGHTGFVGGNLSRQRAWDHLYNRTNIDAIRGRRFDLVVCAGLPSDRWLADGNPGGDRSNMLALAGALAEVDAACFVLVSTAEVYPARHGVDEATAIEPTELRAYAEHRLEFERIVADRFAKCHVVRLTSPFGHGVRRHPLLDLARGRDLDRLHPDSSCQWYPVSRLADDMDRVVERDLGLVNLCSEPVTVSQVHREYFDDLPIGGRAGPAVRDDVRTRHGAAFGGDPRYVVCAERVLAAIGAWLRSLGQFGEVA